VSEAKLRGKVLKLLKPLHGVSVENNVGQGTPDVNFAEGWIELKYLHDWPKIPQSKVPFKYRPAQGAWMARRASQGGNCWWLLQVRSVYLLINAKNMRGSAPIGELNRSELMRKATKCWHGTLPQAEFIAALRPPEPVAEG
jgi:hypothetical protein